MRWIAVLAMACSGCSLIAPGVDTREALAARQTTDYDEAGNFSTEESTTHERNNVVLEGENVTAEFSPDGKLKTLTGATNVMVQISRPRDAAEAKMQLDMANLQFSMRLMDTIDRAIPSLISRIERVEAKAEIKPQPKPEGDKP